jgi:hypothetical protein
MDRTSALALMTSRRAESAFCGCALKADGWVITDAQLLLQTAYEVGPPIQKRCIGRSGESRAGGKSDDGRWTAPE